MRSFTPSFAAIALLSWMLSLALLATSAQARVLPPSGPGAAARTRATTSLLQAMRRGQLDRARILLTEHGADPNVRDGRGGSPLIAAAGWKNTAGLCRLLLDRGARPGDADHFGATPLMAAASSGNIAAVRMLLDAGAPVDAADKFGQTALYIAAYGAEPQIAAVLLAAGARIERANRQGMTPLMAGAARGSLPVVETLLADGADPTATAHGGYTALKLATTNRRRAVADRLREVLAEQQAGAPAPVRPVRLVPAEQQGLNDALRRALDDRKMGAPAIAALLDRGADPNGQRDDGTPYLVAMIVRGRQEIALALLDRGADPNRADHSGVTPLMAAAGVGDARLVDRLLVRGAVVDAAPKDGRTPLLRAAESGSVAVVQRLLRAGADPAQRSPVTGKSAAETADAAGQTAVAAVLRQAESGLALGPTHAQTDTP